MPRWFRRNELSLRPVESSLYVFVDFNYSSHPRRDLNLLEHILITVIRKQL